MRVERARGPTQRGAPGTVAAPCAHVVARLQRRAEQTSPPPLPRDGQGSEDAACPGRLVVYVTPSAPGSSRCELCEPVLQGALRSRAEGDRATLSWLHALLPPTAPELEPRARGPSTDFFLLHFYRGPHSPIDDRKVTKLPHDKVILHDKNQLETDPDVQS